MSVFQIAYILFMLVCGIVGSIVGARWGCLFALLGGAVGVATGYGFLCSGVILHPLFDKFRPPFPRCEKEMCHWRDYVAIEATERGIIVMCKCGDKYLKIRDRFFFIMPDQSLRPYMKRSTMMRWKRDLT